jgi:hypothetical protein
METNTEDVENSWEPIAMYAGNGWKRNSVDVENSWESNTRAVCHNINKNV